MAVKGEDWPPPPLPVPSFPDLRAAGMTLDEFRAAINGLVAAFHSPKRAPKIEPAPREPLEKEGPYR